MIIDIIYKNLIPVSISFSAYEKNKWIFALSSICVYGWNFKELKWFGVRFFKLKLNPKSEDTPIWNGSDSFLCTCFWLVKIAVIVWILVEMRDRSIDK